MSRHLTIAVISVLLCSSAYARPWWINFYSEPEFEPQRLGYTIRTSDLGSQVEIDVSLDQTAARALLSAQLVLNMSEKTDGHILRSWLRDFENEKKEKRISFRVSKHCLAGSWVHFRSGAVHSRPASTGLVNFSGYRLWLQHVVWDAISDSVAGEEKPNPRMSPIVQWSPARNGLSMGIELPSSYFVFEPVNDWSGQLIVVETDPTGHLTKRGNPGGQWSKTALLKVYLKNTSDEPILWSGDSDVWLVSLPGLGIAKPVEWPGPKPPPFRRGPHGLGPGDQTVMQFNIGKAGDIWPTISPGLYSVTISYSPNKLVSFTQGTEQGSMIHPYDVPDFWKGTIATPPILVSVRHPVDASSGPAEASGR